MQGILKEIEILKASEFPYPDSQDALLNIETVFVDLRNRVQRQINEGAGDDAIVSLSAEVTIQIAQNLPLLGHILRSTNVRNAFEFYGPLVRMARQLLGGDARLVLSSEWEFSPFTYPPAYPHLSNFILIGLPASESANALIVPLCGHEFGHRVWRRYNYASALKPKLESKIIEHIHSKWAEYVTSFPGVRQEDILTNIIGLSIFATASNWALAQCQEVFCDLLGLRIFGESYLHAFQYILAPYLGERRSPRYPAILDRVRYLLTACESFAIKWPTDYATNFANEPEELGTREKLLVSASDSAVQGVLPEMCNQIAELCTSKNISAPSMGPARTVFNLFKMIIPAQGIGHLPDVINGGWMARYDPSLWAETPIIANRRNEILNELLLKSFEVLDYEYLIERK